jgi:hypothetical protein
MTISGTRAAIDASPSGSRAVAAPCALQKWHWQLLTTIFSGESLVLNSNDKLPQWHSPQTVVLNLSIASLPCWIANDRNGSVAASRYRITWAAAFGCGLNGSTQHPYKTAPFGFRSRGSYRAVQSAGAATDSGERAGSSKNWFGPGAVV